MGGSCPLATCVSLHAYFILKLLFNEDLRSHNIHKGCRLYWKWRISSKFEKGDVFVLYGAVEFRSGISDFVQCISLTVHSAAINSSTFILSKELRTTFLPSQVPMH